MNIMMFAVQILEYDNMTWRFTVAHVTGCPGIATTVLLFNSSPVLKDMNNSLTR